MVDHIHIENYTYHLPDNRIAKFPLKKRDDSKLLVYKNGEISETVFNRIADEIPENSLLIFNNTKVIQARLHFQKETGAKIEIFCLEPVEPTEYELIFQQTGTCVWLCMVGNLKKWKSGNLYQHIEIGNRSVCLQATWKEKRGDSFLIEFSWDNSSVSFAEILETAGELPIPPYLNRKTEEADKKTYQTVYSKIKGSVAAPTAGLHFTQDVFDRLKTKNVVCEELTLHVGAGTFRPVKSGLIADHEMHTEFFSVKKQTIEKLITHRGKIIAVGTTTVRTLESLYYLGKMLENNPETSVLKVSQWMPYESPDNISKEKALQNLLDYSEKIKSDTLVASTQIMIVPGYRFKTIDGMITNFHQPQSTLLLLVSAFLDGNWKMVYDYALSHDFRFLSYGDSSLLWRK
ncbi:MAG: S-adenosylmethionine:tRNA ribosyltransferase-isomerase [Candidatus Azobacteroides sp.]|nr:S-adenosylmethionine:tRNA ribosyltransferase-isomerase [Candidatus Azobacteroides sp.]